MPRCKNIPTCYLVRSEICASKVSYAVVQGIVKALFENGLLPKVISGSSVGSISERPLPRFSDLMGLQGSI